MSCDRFADAWPLHAADLLDPEEAVEAVEHLEEGCPLCAGRLAEARAALALLPLALEPVAASPAVWERLERRIEVDGLRPRGAPRPVPMPVATAAAGSRLWTAGAAVLAAALAAGAVWMPMRRAQGRMEEAMRDQSREIALLRESMQAATERVRVLLAPELRVLLLQGSGPQPEARGRVFWDRSRRVWHLYAANLKPPGPGRTYELWFITADQRKIPAGTFDPLPSGEASLVTSVPAEVGEIVVTAVTDEPAGGVSQPTGKIHLLAEIKDERL